jgi:hypothetical protein
VIVLRSNVIAVVAVTPFGAFAVNVAGVLIASVMPEPVRVPADRA